MAEDQLPTTIAPARVSRLLTADEFHRLADVPPEVEWFANLSNPQTRRAYENAVKDFVRFAGIMRPEEFRTVTRAYHRLARRAGAARARRQHRLASLASLFEYLCGRNAVTHNPVKGVERPKAEAAKVKRRRSATTRPASYSPRRRTTQSRASATARSCRRCCWGPSSCRRLQTSGLVLANRADSCSN
jgi:hypothetical protein